MSEQPSGPEQRGRRHKADSSREVELENHAEASEELERMLGTGQLAREQILTQIADPNASPESKAMYLRASDQLTAMEDIVLEPFGIRDGQLLQHRQVQHGEKLLSEIRRFVTQEWDGQRVVAVISRTGEAEDIGALVNDVRMADPSEGQAVSSGTAIDVGNAALRYNDYLRLLAERTPDQLEAELFGNPAK